MKRLHLVILLIALFALCASVSARLGPPAQSDLTAISPGTETNAWADEMVYGTTASPPEETMVAMLETTNVGAIQSAPDKFAKLLDIGDPMTTAAGASPPASDLLKITVRTTKANAVVRGSPAITYGQRNSIKVFFPDNLAIAAGPPSRTSAGWTRTGDNWSVCNKGSTAVGTVTYGGA